VRLGVAALGWRDGRGQIGLAANPEDPAEGRQVLVEEQMNRGGEVDAAASLGCKRVSGEIGNDDVAERCRASGSAR
jgi:hypothetical protein